MIGDLKTKEESYEFRFKHESQTWSDDAERIHGFSRKQARSFPGRSKSMDDFIGLMSSIGELDRIVCHCAYRHSPYALFDMSFLFAAFWVHDKRSEFYQLFPEKKISTTICRTKNDYQRYGIANQRLETWALKLGLEYPEEHNALNDADIAYEVFKYQQERL